MSSVQIANFQAVGPGRRMTVTLPEKNNDKGGA